MEHLQSEDGNYISHIVQDPLGDPAPARSSSICLDDFIPSSRELRNDSIEEELFEPTRQYQSPFRAPRPVSQQYHQRLVGGPAFRDDQLALVELEQEQHYDRRYFDETMPYPVELHRPPPCTTTTTRPSSAQYYNPNQARFKRDKQRLRELHYRHVQRRRGGTTTRHYRGDDNYYRSASPTSSENELTEQSERRRVSLSSETSDNGYYYGDDECSTDYVVDAEVLPPYFRSEEASLSSRGNVSLPATMPHYHQEQRVSRRRNSVDMVHHDSPIGPAISVYPTGCDWQNQRQEGESSFANYPCDDAARHNGHSSSCVANKRQEEPDGGSLRQSSSRGNPHNIYQHGRHKRRDEGLGFHDDKKKPTAARPPRPPTMVEISPGVRVRLRSAAETKECVKYDFFTPCQCCACDMEMLCIKDADYVICPNPACRVISPLSTEMATFHDDAFLSHKEMEGVEQGVGGLGLGFTWQELAKLQEEIISSRGHHLSDGKP